MAPRVRAQTGGGGAAVVGGGVLFVAVAAASLSRRRGGRSSSGGGLSALRQRALDVVARYVPSAWPDAKFRALDPGYNPFDPSLPDGYTTCGSLPGRMGVELGDPTGITRWGVEGARIEGEKKGAWVKANGHNRPAPGDIVGLSKVSGGGLVHVGVFIGAQGNDWTTADAGQGTHDQQRAEYVTRIYDPASITLTRPGGEPRYLAGWINLAAWPFPRAKRVRRLRPAAAESRYPRVDLCDPNECRRAA